MRFGGHQTFTIRDGWLHKGTKLLVEDPDKLVDEYAADYLGVGRNMAKAINHWLLATGLAEKCTETGKSGRIKTLKDLKPTKFAEIIWKYDPYFLDIHTWWMIHTNLVHNADDAATWNWFFNNFRATRFQKAVCLQALIRRETAMQARISSESTLDRDLSCFLNTYAKSIPSMREDPEDEIESPLVELGLMRHYRKSGYYQEVRDAKKINVKVFLYAAAKALAEDADAGRAFLEVPFHDLSSMPNGPGMVFALTNEGLFENLMDYGDSGLITLIGLAGDRLVRIKNCTPLAWAVHYYEGTA